MSRSAIAALRGGFARLPVTERVVGNLRPGSHRKAGGLWGGSGALLIEVLHQAWKGPILVVTCDDGDSLQLADDLATFGCRGASILPRQEFDADSRPEPQSRGGRARVVAELARTSDFLLVACIEGLLQPVPTPKSLRRGQVDWQQGQKLSREAALMRALAAGMSRVPVVLAPGEVSLRGDVLDLYPLASDAALRLEFFDDELESIRTFDPGSQASLRVLEQVSVIFGETGEGDEGSPLRHLSTSELLVVHYEPLRIEERSALLASFHADVGRRLQGLNDTLHTATRLDVSALPSHDLDFKILSAGSAVGSGEADPVGRLRSIRGMRGAVHIACRTEEEVQRLQEILAHRKLDLTKEQVTLSVGALSRGFRIPELRRTVISNVEFAGVPAATRVKERPVVPSKAIASFFELGPGDLVVHAVHGIARFVGIELVERGDGAEDHLRLNFRDDVQLLVPASKIHLIQKYVGSGVAMQLDKLGGRGFARRKEQVQEALFDLAADLLDVQSKRSALRREPFPPDDLEQDFLDGFPFEDTEDQKTSWAEVRQDLEKPQPMDRLLCGDVGFGKTELALRAAFRVAITGRQVAVLVPTTLLSEQHHHTFEQRFSPLGLCVDVLTRRRSTKDRKRLLEGLLLGRIDVLIGTHRILNKDVEFKELGLVVVDEEQRFGVRHKEHLKQLRLLADVLTLTATPIPRTLHSALLGIRGISTLSSPPPGRQEVETHVVFHDDRVVQEALQRELSRDGQVFVLHNRVASLSAVARRIEKLAPGARVTIGHGQMTEAETERTVRSFVRGNVDVLVCTTIVENGLDLPRANTIIIDRADQFGLAELHQLRGRVGRSSVKAYCYLMMDRERPPGEHAKKRLKALEEFSHLGAGFAIAMKDLEIRGAGNLLGPQQSGHIAAVGYDMYCRLLREAVDDARQEQRVPHEVVEVDVDLRVQAFLPESFLPDPKSRLELLREMDDAVDDSRAAAIERDLRDRFGKLPQPVVALLRVFRLKHGLQALGVRGVQLVEPERLVARHAPDQPLGGAWLDAFTDVRAVEAGKTHLILPRPRRGPKQRTGEQVLAFLLDALSAGGSEPIMSADDSRSCPQQQGSPSRKRRSARR